MAARAQSPTPFAVRPGELLGPLPATPRQRREPGRRLGMGRLHAQHRRWPFAPPFGEPAEMIMFPAKCTGRPWLHTTVAHGACSPLAFQLSWKPAAPWQPRRRASTTKVLRWERSTGARSQEDVRVCVCVSVVNSDLATVWGVGVLPAEALYTSAISGDWRWLAALGLAQQALAQNPEYLPALLLTAQASWPAAPNSHRHGWPACAVLANPR